MAPRTRSTDKETGDKRKHDEVEDQKPPTKEASPPTDQADQPETDDGPPSKALKRDTLQWLLSDEAFDLANPEIPEGHGEVDLDESEQRKVPPKSDIDQKHQSKGNQSIIRYPDSSLTPFQNLVAASILSKPLSHKLGIRAIQTLLNPPFSLRTLKDLDEAGYEGRRKALWEARTQHKEKTAGLLGDLVEGVKQLCGEDEEDLSELKPLREKLKDVKSPAEAQDIVVDTLTQIRGVGPGVASIFLRRVQADWEEVFPYIDDRALKAARAYDLLDDGQGADQLASKLGHDRHQYARLVDTLVGLDLEKRI